MATVLINLGKGDATSEVFDVAASETATIFLAYYDRNRDAAQVVIEQKNDSGTYEIIYEMNSLRVDESRKIIRGVGTYRVRRTGGTCGVNQGETTVV